MDYPGTFPFIKKIPIGFRIEEDYICGEFNEFCASYDASEEKSIYAAFTKIDEGNIKSLLHFCKKYGLPMGNEHAEWNKLPDIYAHLYTIKTCMLIRELVYDDSKGKLLYSLLRSMMDDRGDWPCIQVLSHDGSTKVWIEYDPFISDKNFDDYIKKLEDGDHEELSIIGRNLVSQIINFEIKDMDLKLRWNEKDGPSFKFEAESTMQIIYLSLLECFYLPHYRCARSGCMGVWPVFNKRQTYCHRPPCKSSSDCANIVRTRRYRKNKLDDVGSECPGGFI